MILIDSSAWIEYYRRSGSPPVKESVKLAIRNDEAAVNGIIYVEILSFVSEKQDFQELRSDFSSFHWFELGKKDFQSAALMGRELRKKGITIPASDLIIAASAGKHKAAILHLDNHFETLASHFKLATIAF